MDLLELGKLYGSRIGYHRNILLRTNGREQKQRQKSYFCKGTRGEIETESPILWLVELEFLAVGWWWCEAQSIIQGWLETHILNTWLRERQSWEWVRLSDCVKETHCVVEPE